MNDCYCDYDYPEMYSKDVRIARKVHKCCECGRTIKPKEKYEHVAGKWEGYFDTFDTCIYCIELREWVTNNIPCFCWAHGNMREDARNAVDDIAHEIPGIMFGLLRHEVKIYKGRLHAKI